MKSFHSVFHPEPVEGNITGSQPSADPLASSLTEGLAVQAPGAEQSAPAADETDQELARLRADLSRDRQHIAAMLRLIERRGDELRDKARRLVTLEASRRTCTEAAA